MLRAHSIDDQSVTVPGGRVLWWAGRISLRSLRIKQISSNIQSIPDKFPLYDLCLGKKWVYASVWIWTIRHGNSISDARMVPRGGYPWGKIRCVYCIK